MEKRVIYCCGCNEKVFATLTTGKEIYPTRTDLHLLPFWVCNICKNYVGCHHKTTNNTTPLGCIPTKELRNARMYIHALIDPIWKNGIVKRNYLYKKISEKAGWKYHTSKIKTIEEARIIYLIAKKLINEIMVNTNV
jgi:hypothetical protein